MYNAEFSDRKLSQVYTLLPSLLLLIAFSSLYQQLQPDNIANRQMSYFQRHQKQSQNSFSSQHQASLQQNNNTAEFKKNSESKQSYLKAFKKYYIDKLLQNKLGNSDIQTRSNQENTSINKVRSHHQNETKSVYRKEPKSIEKERSVATDCTKKSKERSTPGKISRSKIVNLVNNNDSELQEMLYSSITEMEREMMTFGDLNDLARENKLLKCSISKLKQILKEKLEIALKKNKQELTVMFDEYSNMIKKLLQDKETLTNQLENEKLKHSNQEKRWIKLEEEYENQIKNIGEENATQISQTKQQIEEFLDLIIQYQEEANNEKAEVEKLREKMVELEMENDRLKNDVSDRDTRKYGSFSQNQQEEQQLQKYALKIESLLTMLQQLQNQNEQLNLFLKSCKCSRIELHKTSNDSMSSPETAKEIAKKYERQLVQAEKEYLKEETYLRQVLKRKDECIDRLNLVIEQLRKARYASVDRLTEDALKKQISQIMR